MQNEKFSAMLPRSCRYADVGEGVASAGGLARYEFGDDELALVEMDLHGFAAFVGGQLFGGQVHACDRKQIGFELLTEDARLLVAARARERAPAQRGVDVHVA